MSFDRSRFKELSLLLASALFALSGCNTVHKHIGEEDPYFGEAVKYNTALQVVNPEPTYAPDAAKPGSNGDKGAHAVKRYRTDTVKPVEPEQTTAGSASASSPH